MLDDIPVYAKVRFKIIWHGCGELRFKYIDHNNGLYIYI